MTARCIQPTSRTKAMFCRYCLMPGAGERVPEGFVGFFQWMDPELAQAWFRKAVELSDPVFLATYENKPLAEQFGAVAAIYRALQFGYMALNLPAGTDPAYREMWRKWFAGYPPTDAMPDIEWDSKQYSVPPEVAIRDGQISGDFRYIWEDDPAMKARMTFSDSGRTPEQRFGILRARVADRVMKAEHPFHGRLRVQYPVMLDSLGLFEYNAWPFAIGGPYWDDANNRIRRAENQYRPSPGNRTDLDPLLSHVSDDAMANGLRVAGNLAGSNEWFGSMAGIPGNFDENSRGLGPMAPITNWRQWYLSPRGVANLWQLHRASVYASPTTFDMIEPARWLAQACSTKNWRTGRAQNVTAQDIVWRARLNAKERAEALASAGSGSIADMIGGAGEAQAQMDRWRNTPPPAMEETGSAIMAVGGAVMAGAPYVGAAIMAVGAGISIIGAYVKEDYTAHQDKMGTNEFGDWKPDVGWPFLSGGVAANRPPSTRIPAPEGFTRSENPPGPGLDACEAYNSHPAAIQRSNRTSRVTITRSRNAAIEQASTSPSLTRRIMPYAVGGGVIAVTGATAYMLARWLTATKGTK